MPITLEARLTSALDKYNHHPSDIDILNEICECLIALKQDEKVLPWAEKILLINPFDVISMTRRANALYLLGRYVESVDAWENHPCKQDNPIYYKFMSGMSTMMVGDLIKAISLLSDAWNMSLSCEPTLSPSIGFTLGESMLKNDDSRGFVYWLMRNDVPRLSFNYSPTDVPVWDGKSDLYGKRVLITHGLGFGDNFLLLSCIKDWQKAGAKIMLTCNSYIYELIQTSLPDCEVVSAPDSKKFHSPLPDKTQLQVNKFSPHLHATLLHLPLLKAKGSEPSIISFQSYIQVPDNQHQAAIKWSRQLREKHQGKKLVGLFWDCAQRHWSDVGAVIRCWAERRSLPLTVVNKLIECSFLLEKIHFVNLHHSAITPLSDCNFNNISNYIHGIQDFSDTAACITQLDAVVAVDSSVANLSAMMGVPTCVVTHTTGDWRWGMKGTESPWISNAIIFRQTDEGVWEDVIQNLNSWLLNFCSTDSVEE